VPALSGLPVLDPPPLGAVPEMPLEAHRLRGHLGPGDAAHVHRQPPTVDAGARAALRARDRRVPGAGGSAAHDGDRELPGRRRVHRHAAAGHLRGARGRRRVDSPVRTGSGGVTKAKPEHQVVISGVGQSDIGRRLNRAPLELTLDACLAAIEDAGLTTADIDGISTYPGTTGQPPGFTGAGAIDVFDALRLELGWWSGGLERPGQLGAVVDGAMAVAF